LHFASFDSMRNVYVSFGLIQPLGSETGFLLLQLSQVVLCSERRCILVDRTSTPRGTRVWRQEAYWILIRRGNQLKTWFSILQRMHPLTVSHEWRNSMSKQYATGEFNFFGKDLTKCHHLIFISFE
jgi:hypothetical protein